mmetsp:Transcript_5077/g.15471  ORF Transcript_5077/g.15471 Transcript_5077/m.15471 type:complete len:99 (-) Transcript_5077:1062-1358(-)|eukprot:scaffold178110_cov41-Tisochrysis_lutea.AAC.3
MTRHKQMPNKGASRRLDQRYELTTCSPHDRYKTQHAARNTATGAQDANIYIEEHHPNRGQLVDIDATYSLSQCQTKSSSTNSPARCSTMESRKQASPA